MKRKAPQQSEVWLRANLETVLRELESNPKRLDRDQRERLRNIIRKGAAGLADIPPVLIERLVEGHVTSGFPYKLSTLNREYASILDSIYKKKIALAESKSPEKHNTACKWLTDAGKGCARVPVPFRYRENKSVRAICSDYCLDAKHNGWLDNWLEHESSFSLRPHETYTLYDTTVNPRRLILTGSIDATDLGEDIILVHKKRDILRIDGNVHDDDDDDDDDLSLHITFVYQHASKTDLLWAEQLARATGLSFKDGEIVAFKLQKQSDRTSMVKKVIVAWLALDPLNQVAIFSNFFRGIPSSSQYEFESHTHRFRVGKLEDIWKYSYIVPGVSKWRKFTPPPPPLSHAKKNSKKSTMDCFKRCPIIKPC